MDAVVVVDRSEIRAGKLDELREAVRRLAAFVESNEADPIAYHVYFDAGATEMTVVQIHPTSESLERHMAVAGPEFRAFAELLTLRRVDVFGRPSATVVEALRQKARLLGDAPVAVHEPQAGFARFGVPVG